LPSRPLELHAQRIERQLKIAQAAFQNLEILAGLESEDERCCGEEKADHARRLSLMSRGARARNGPATQSVHSAEKTRFKASRRCNTGGAAHKCGGIASYWRF